MQVSEVKVLYMTNPLGIDRTPWFSWKLASEEENTLQEAYQIRVTEVESGRETWNSGKVESGENLYIDYEGERLASRTGYRVEVTVWDNHGNRAVGSARFETALLGKEEWMAKWAVSAAYRRKGRVWQAAAGDDVLQGLHIERNARQGAGVRDLPWDLRTQREWKTPGRPLVRAGAYRIWEIFMLPDV